MSAAAPRGSRQAERGYLMVALTAAVTIMMILSLIGYQEWAEVLRRDNEAEMIFRAQDIVRSIQRYRQDHGGAAPPKLEDLMEPGPQGQYYLRRLYEDPLTKDGEWGLLYIGAGGVIIDPSAPPDAIPEEGLDGGRSRLRSSFGDRRAGERDSRFPGGARSDAPGSPGGGIGGVGAPAVGDVSGLPIAGVKSLCKDKPFRVYKGFTEYSQWLFTYLDLDPQAAGAPGQPGGPNAPGGPGGSGQQGGANAPGGPGGRGQQGGSGGMGTPGRQGSAGGLGAGGAGQGRSNRAPGGSGR